MQCPPCPPLLFVFSWVETTAGGGRVVAGKGSGCRRKQTPAVGKFHPNAITSTNIMLRFLSVVIRLFSV